VPIGAVPNGAGLLADVVTGVELPIVVVVPGAEIASDGDMAGILAGALPTAVLVAAGEGVTVALGVIGLAAGVGVTVALGAIGLAAGVGVTVALGAIGLAAGVGVTVALGTIGLAAGVGVTVALGAIGLAAGVGVTVATGVVGAAPEEIPAAVLLAGDVGLAAGGAVIESAGGIGGITGDATGVVLVADETAIAGVAGITAGVDPIVGIAGGETVGRLSAIGGIGKLELLGATVAGLSLPVLADNAISGAEIGLVVGAIATPVVEEVGLVAEIVWEPRLVLALAAALFTPVGDPPA
jgi:hypothetical protein